MGGRVLVEVVAVGVVAGEMLAGSRKLDPDQVTTVLGGFAFAATLGAAFYRRRGSGAWLGATGLVAALAGSFLVHHVTAVPTDPTHVARLALPMHTRLVGRVLAPPVMRAGDAVVIVEAREVAGSRGVHGRVRLRIRGPSALARGDLIALDTTLRRPRNFENPGGFDAVGALARQQVHVVASTWDAGGIERVSSPTSPILGALDAWRQAVRTVVQSATRPDMVPVLLALVLGDESDIPADVRAVFTRAGVVHVLSVSGLHMGIAMVASAGLMGWLLARHEGLLVRYDMRAIALTGGLAVATLYAALTGFAVATTRALVMAGVGVLAVALERSVEPVRALALAGLLLAVVAPGAPLEISYQLSFVSVAALVLASGRTRRDGHWVERGVRAAWTAWAWTAPLTAFHFHQVSLVSVLANPVVVPLFEGVSLLPALVGAILAPVAPGPARLAFTIASQPLRLAVALVRHVGGWAWAAIDVPLPNLAELLLLYAVLGGVWARRSTPGRAVAIAALVALALDAGGWLHARYSRTGIRMTALDVGQGDAAVVELPGGRVLVVDAGGFAGSAFDTGAAVVEPFLRARKIQHVDALVMSHAHPDHAGGLAHLVRHLAPAELWWGGIGGEGRAWEETVRALRETGTPTRRLQAGTIIPGFPEVAVLHPPTSWPSRSLNEGSLVLRVQVDAVAILLAGDAEREAETAMLESGAPLGATVLKVPHHGSRTSSTPAFLEAVEPEFATISSGADNRFGHPAPDVVQRYRDRGVALYRTDQCGAIELELAATGVTVHTYRPCAAPVVTMRPPP